MKLHLADWDLPFNLTIDINEEQTAGAVILSQGQGKASKIIIMVGRELTATESSATLPEVTLRIAYWGVKRL
jgi:hypothetical protein